MIKYALTVICLLAVLLMPRMAIAQAPSPEALATARQLVAVARSADNVKTMLPSLVQALKSAIVQGRPQVEKDYDAIAPVLIETFSSRLGEFTETVAVIYATTFSVEEMNDIIAFYRTSTGQKLLAKTPTVLQQSMAAGGQFGARIGRELQSRLIEELRKKGHNI